MSAICTVLLTHVYAHCGGARLVQVVIWQANWKERHCD
jgi:hypothetical protein